MSNKDFLKNNPVFWSRLGFCYDPPIKNQNGKPLVFTENFEKQIESHRDFSVAGVKIHTCILHLGWMGVNEYDYSLTDRVVEAIFSSDEDIFFIPRIKLNVPVDWCRENPEDVFVYYGGPKTKEEIAALVGTEKQDYFGYEAPDGYYRSGDYVDKRANVGGVIARQSFSSKKWLEDAGIALEKLIDRLENGPYGDRIIGYHLAYGISGETVTWGRINKKYGDYGITNRREFYKYGIQKYGSKEKLKEVWLQEGLTEDSVILPSVEQRTGKTESLQGFLRGYPEDRLEIDYDLFVSDANAAALEYFAKIAKCKTNKLVGAFYGYSLYIDNASYSGHIALERLLNSPYVDFFASPKAYARSSVGEPGGEICPAQSINLKKIFVDELDNRTYLATENAEDIKSGFVPKGFNETLTVMRREFSKDLSHDSGFWWMDLGGGWFSSEPLMDEIRNLVELNRSLRQQAHKSIADMLIVYDERSMALIKESVDFHKGFLREFINEAHLSGVVCDIYRQTDLPLIDLSNYRLIVFAFDLYVDEKTREIIKNLPEDITVAYSYATGVWNEKGFDFENGESLTHHRIKLDKKQDRTYDFPRISAERIDEYRKNDIYITTPYLKSNVIKEMARKAGCHIYTEKEKVTVYGDNRFLAVFTSLGGGEIKMKRIADYKDIFSGQRFDNTDSIPLPKEDFSAMFIVEVV